MTSCCLIYATFDFVFAFFSTTYLLLHVTSLFFRRVNLLFGNRAKIVPVITHGPHSTAHNLMIQIARCELFFAHV